MLNMIMLVLEDGAWIKVGGHCCWTLVCYENE